MNKFLLPLLVGIALVASSLVFYLIGKGNGYQKGYSDALSSFKSDTVVVRDTIVYDHPVPVAVKPAGMEMYPAGTLAQMQHLLDSLSAFKPDTTFVEIPVPIETKRYGGRPGDEYEAQVSGWHPSLDWIKVNQQTAYITNTIEKPTPYKWTLSAFGDVGYPLGVRAGLTFDKQAIGPLRWYIQGGYEYNPTYKGVFVQGGVRLDILKK